MENKWKLRLTSDMTVMYTHTNDNNLATIYKHLQETRCFIHIIIIVNLNVYCDHLHNLPGIIISIL